MFDLDYLNLLSWRIKQEHYEDVEKIKNSMAKIIEKDYELLTLVNVIVGMWNLNVYDDDNSKGYAGLTFNISRNHHVDMALKLIPEIIRERENLNKSIQCIIDKQLDVFSFIKQME